MINQANKIEQERGFDCVKMMRDIRNKLDVKLEGLTLKEEHEFLDKLIKREVKL
jgi:hypothetical protein